jgi:GTP-binding protein
VFIDRVEISIRAGNGGSGHVSFYRDKLTMRGGPDGGDGGKGGDIIFQGTTRADNLIDFRFTKKFAAEDGVNGSVRNRAGANGKDVIINVPLGTRIMKITRDDSTTRYDLIADITQDGQQFRALRGGGGGRGNAAFATSRKQTPNFSQSGIKVSEYRVLLELSCIADVGLVGYPNVGKSTLLSVISRANPKIANYHFTTLYPNLAAVSMFNKGFIVADIPGLIEGASKGAGLGIDFLRHISRTKMLVHIIDISAQDGRDPLDDWRVINLELQAYGASVDKLPQIIALNKADLLESEEKVQAFEKAVNKGKTKHQIFKISAATHQGVPELMQAVAIMVDKLPKTVAQTPTVQLEEKIDANSFAVEKKGDKYHVTGAFVDNLIRGVVLSDTESNAYFQKRLIAGGVIEALRKIGLKDGESVQIADIEFEYFE